MFVHIPVLFLLVTWHSGIVYEVLNNNIIGDIMQCKVRYVKIKLILQY